MARTMVITGVYVEGWAYDEIEWDPAVAVVHLHDGRDGDGDCDCGPWAARGSAPGWHVISGSPETVVTARNGAEYVITPRRPPHDLD